MASEATLSPSFVQTYDWHAIRHASLCGWRGLVKRILDVVVSCVGLLLLLPIFAILALVIKLESPGPVFFVQRRVGYKGKVFRMYKLRSMVADAESRLPALRAYNEIDDGVIFKMANDPRITRIGRFLRITSIDELPQLFNVLRGDMSLIGPRPSTVPEVAEFEAYQLRRLEVLPGCSGLWQVSGRSDIKSFKKMVEFDLNYIDRWSLGFDLALLCKTMPVVLRCQGSC